VNYPIILKLLSVIVFSLAIAFLASMGVGALYWSAAEAHALDGWIVSTVVAFILSGALAYAGRTKDKRLHRREGLTVIGLGWLLASLVGALPYLLIVPECTVADAFFESTSGLTTTGASVFGNFPDFPRSLLFWRCLSQWIGGLGVVVFFVAVLGFLGAGAKLLYSRESSATSQDIESGRMQKGVLRIMQIYGVLSVACTLVYYFCGMDFFEALCHMFTTLSTGGFGLYAESMAYWNSPAIEWACIVFMAAGGTSFFFLIHLMRGNWRACRRNTEVKAYYAIILGVTTLFSLMLVLQAGVDDAHEAIRSAAFQTVSILTTTGYATADFTLWPAMGGLVLLVLMFVGGCSGSTGGGCKVVRFIIGGRVSLMEIERAFRPQVVRPVKINGRFLDKDERDSVLVFFMLVWLIIFLTFPLITLFEPDISLVTAVSAGIACLFNIGPGLGEVGPMGNFGFLHSGTKYMLSILMIMGRLELFAILVLFAPSLWKRFA